MSNTETIIENASLFAQLGIDWKLFLGQALNFFILLAVLTIFVYKPLIKVIKERSKKIKEGLEKAEEAGIRLQEIDVIGKEKIKEAEGTAMNIIKATENKAKVLDQDIQKKAEEKQLQMQKELQQMKKKQEEEVKDLVYKNAVDLVKKTLVKTIELKPNEIDDALIKKAAESIAEE